MTRVLVDIYKISVKDVVVLSQYRLQCDKISTALAACGKPDVAVRTVIQSQGMFPYKHMTPRTNTPIMHPRAGNPIDAPVCVILCAF